jgi:DNA-directed RNA polymerase specialized sigma subunit
MKTKSNYDFDKSFYVLAREVTESIAKSQNGSDQKQQVEELMRSEIMFKETILKYRQSTEIYKKFLQHIRIKQKNILSARPFFRESAVSFSKKITPAIKGEDIQLLQTFDINYQLIKFMREKWLGPFPKKAEQLFERVHVARERLISLNMPLAINRAKLFYRKTPKSHLSLMDMIGICSMGLIAGIDKYCGPYKKVWRSVAIGRMVGNLIDEYSATTLHFYPSDKRILYKANSIRGRQGIDDVKELTSAVKESFVADSLEGKSIPKTDLDVGVLSDLMAAASTCSADATVNDEGFGVYSFTVDEEQDVEDLYVQRETLTNVLMAAKKLPLLYRKVLLLKGIKL